MRLTAGCLTGCSTAGGDRAESRRAAFRFLASKNFRARLMEEEVFLSFFIFFLYRGVWGGCFLSFLFFFLFIGSFWIMMPYLE